MSKNPVFEKISAFNRDLLPDKVALKYELMRKDIYKFYRGTCHLFYEDLEEYALPGSPKVWSCGDLHLENFGSYKGDNRLVYFDMNDFDEAMLGPASGELIRFVCSVFVAFESLKIERQKAENMASLFLKVYSDTLAGGKSFYIEPKTAKGIVCDFLAAVSKRKQKDLLLKCTLKKKKTRLLVSNEKYEEIPGKEKAILCEHMNEWIVNNSGRPYNYEVMDVAFRVAGLGSLGLKRYLFLLKSTNLKEKYLLIDMKQSRSSSLTSSIHIKQPHWKYESQRITTVQAMMQNIAPFLLSTVQFGGESYVVQELQPTKDSINFKLIKDQYRDIYQVINDMAILTASAQLRSSGRMGSHNADALIKFGKDPDWQEPLIAIALKQAAQIKRQYKSFCSEMDSKEKSTSKA